MIKKPEIPSDERIEQANKLGGQQYMVAVQHSLNVLALDTCCKRAIAQAATDDCYEKMLRQFVEWLGLLENRLTPDSSLSLVDRQSLQAHLEEVSK